MLNWSADAWKPMFRRVLRSWKAGGFGRWRSSDAAADTQPIQRQGVRGNWVLRHLGGKETNQRNTLWIFSFEVSHLRGQVRAGRLTLRVESGTPRIWKSNMEITPSRFRLLANVLEGWKAVSYQP